MAALWEYQETDAEGVRLALALVYHSLLRIRVPIRAETSDMFIVSLCLVIKEGELGGYK